ncbi:MAG: SDR family NAD(P)-dependent oxidoreductase [Chloroflexota bacterium]
MRTSNSDTNSQATVSSSSLDASGHHYDIDFLCNSRYLSTNSQDELRIMLKRKIALVTGGGTGIGKAIALRLAQNGANVAIASRSQSHLEQAQEELKKLGLSILPLQMDLRNKSDIQQAVAAIMSKWGAVHILVNNAGRSGLSMMNDPDDSKWYDIIDTNLNGLYLVTKAVLEIMPDQAGGRIINISSVLGKFGVPGYTAYCTTKHGMIGFSRALALEVVNRGITVNTICPGWVDTDMAVLGIKENAALQGITAEEFRAQAAAAVPIKRFLQAEEIAELVCYVASEAARGITGQAINICGGQVMV